MTLPSFVVLDLETSGLDPDTCTILELGILLLDRQLNEIDSFSALVTDLDAVGHLNHIALRAPDDSDKRYVYEMHQKSGLDADIRLAHASGQQRSIADVELDALKFLYDRGVNAKHGKLALPITGSSVHFDRSFLHRHMPRLEEAFHYRNIDVSTLKGITDMLRDDIRQQREQVLHPARRHRVLDDCRNTRNELAFYLSTYFSKEATSR